MVSGADEPDDVPVLPVEPADGVDPDSVPPDPDDLPDVPPLPSPSPSPEAGLAIVTVPAWIVSVNLRASDAVNPIWCFPSARVVTRR